MKIKCKKDLFNQGQCFTKGKIYEAGHIHNTASLIDTTVINDLGERHCIGVWWREFKLIKK